MSYESRFSAFKYPTAKEFRKAVVCNANIIQPIVAKQALEDLNRLFGDKYHDDPLYSYLEGRFEGIDANAIDHINYTILLEAYVFDSAQYKLEPGDEDYDPDRPGDLITAFDLDSLEATGFLGPKWDTGEKVYLTKTNYEIAAISLHTNLNNKIHIMANYGINSSWLIDPHNICEYWGYMHASKSEYRLREIQAEDIIEIVDYNENTPDDTPPRRLSYDSFSIPQRDRRILNLSKALKLAGIRTLIIQGAYDGKDATGRVSFNKDVVINNFSTTKSKREILAANIL